MCCISFLLSSPLLVHIVSSEAIITISIISAISLTTATICFTLVASIHHVIAVVTTIIAAIRSAFRWRHGRDHLEASFVFGRTAARGRPRPPPRLIHNLVLFLPHRLAQKVHVDRQAALVRQQLGRSAQKAREYLLIGDERVTLKVKLTLVDSERHQIQVLVEKLVLRRALLFGGEMNAHADQVAEHQRQDMIELALAFLVSDQAARHVLSLFDKAVHDRVIGLGVEAPILFELVHVLEMKVARTVSDTVVEIDAIRALVVVVLIAVDALEFGYFCRVERKHQRNKMLVMIGYDDRVVNARLGRHQQRQVYATQTNRFDIAKVFLGENDDGSTEEIGQREYVYIFEEDKLFRGDRRRIVRIFSAHFQRLGPFLI